MIKELKTHNSHIYSLFVYEIS